MQVKISQAESIITKFIKAKIVPMLVGSPGCGKSQLIHKIADDYNLKVVDLRLSQCDPTDLMGFPTVVGKKADYLPMATFPIEGDPIPEGYSGWLLFLDEFNGAPLAVQKAGYKLVLDLMVGSNHLHKNVAIVCAGNLDTDNAAVEEMSTALQSRMSHLELVVDVPDWINWASSNNIDSRITSFISFKPANLYTFKPDHTDKTYACPRTWEFTNRVLNVCDVSEKDFLPMISGTISEGVAREFVAFCKIHENLPKIMEIINTPESIAMPSEPSVLFALTGSVGQNMTEDNAVAMMKFVNRMPKEFQVVTLREVLRRNRAMAKHSALNSWIVTNAAQLY